MSIDYTHGDSPAYDGYREAWASQREAELQARIDELEAELAEHVEMKTAYDENGVPYLVEAEGSEAEHIIDLLKAEQDGRLVVLPCKVGDTVYGTHKILKGRILEIPFKKSMLDDIGSIYFLTREEAEAALEEGSE